MESTHHLKKYEWRTQWTPWHNVALTRFVWCRKSFWKYWFVGGRTYLSSSYLHPTIFRIISNNWLSLMWKDLTLSWRRSLSYRNHPIDLICKSVDWFLYDRDLRHERVNMDNESVGAILTLDPFFFFFLKSKIRDSA